VRESPEVVNRDPVGVPVAGLNVTPQNEGSSSWMSPSRYTHTGIFRQNSEFNLEASHISKD